MSNTKSWAEEDPAEEERAAPSPPKDTQRRDESSGYVYDNEGRGGGYDDRRGGGYYGGGGGARGGRGDTFRDGGGYGGGGGRERDRQPSRELPNEPPFKARVGNLPYSIREDDLAGFFEDCDVTDIYLVRDRATGDLKGYGYVTFREQAGLVRALQRGDRNFIGRPIRVDIADPRPGDRDGRRNTGYGGSMGGGGYSRDRGHGLHGGQERYGTGGRGSEYSHGGYRAGGDYGTGGSSRGGGGMNEQVGFESFGSRRDRDRDGDGYSGTRGPDAPPGGVDGSTEGVALVRKKLMLKSRTKPKEDAGSAAATSKNASIFGGGRAHDELQYEKQRQAKAEAAAKARGKGGRGDRGGRDHPTDAAPGKAIPKAPDTAGNTSAPPPPAPSVVKIAKRPAMAAASNTNNAKNTNDNIGGGPVVDPAHGETADTRTTPSPAPAHAGGESTDWARVKVQGNKAQANKAHGGKAQGGKAQGGKAQGGKAAPPITSQQTVQKKVPDSSNTAVKVAQVDNKFSALNVDDDEEED